MKAMLIDDEPLRPPVKAIQEVLAKEGVDINKDYLFLGNVGANNFQKSVDRLERPPDVAVIDYSLHWKDIDGEVWNGDKVGKYLRERWAKDVPFYIIFVSAYLPTMEGKYEQLVELLDVPYTGFVELGSRFEESIRDHVRFACDVARAERSRSIEALNALPGGVEDYFADHVIGSSPSLMQVGNMVARVSGGNMPILLTGESGTGKELMAKAIHFNSPRAKKPFVAINCSAIPDTLIESELFGHKKNAFTGALTDKDGKFLLADGGTLFLDEVGEMPLHQQPKLLRVLEEHQVEPIGSVKKPIPVDVRVISATNCALKDDIKAGRFRADLYYRLNGFEIPLPPLRDRGHDILELAEHFLNKICISQSLDNCRFSVAAKRMIKNYSWPGNIRELRNAVGRAALLCNNGIIEPRHLPPDAIKTNLSSNGDTWLEQELAFKQKYFKRKLEEANGNISDAAKLAGLSREHFSKTLKALDLK